MKNVDSVARRDRAGHFIRRNPQAVPAPFHRKRFTHPESTVYGCRFRSHSEQHGRHFVNGQVPNPVVIPAPGSEGGYRKYQSGRYFFF